MPERYHSLLPNALREYEEGKVTSYDMTLSKDYAGYMVERIRFEKKKCGID
ncbi:MAG: hypothetical protein K6G12_05980 [Lachnospiraceae bacterium]|nr:hypothetical protein [Lachnospiraceae bacterium]